MIKPTFLKHFDPDLTITIVYTIVEEFRFDWTSTIRYACDATINERKIGFGDFFLSYVTMGAIPYLAFEWSSMIDSDGTSSIL